MATAPRPGSYLESVVRRERESRAQWAQAHADIRRRADDVVSALAGCLAQEIPEAIRDWVLNLALGLMVTHLEMRFWRAEKMLQDICDEAVKLIDAVQSGLAEPDDLRRLAARARATVQADNAAERAEVPAKAAELANYVSGHIRMRFRPYGRRRLTSLMEGHLNAILDNPLPQILEMEEGIGRLELGCADELDAARGAAPAV